MARTPTTDENRLERFDAFWRLYASGCHIWIGGRQHKYGAFRWGPGRSVRAHRAAWELHRGPIPDGLDVLHTCDVPLCVNPDHLWLGTHVDNNRDRDMKGRTGAPRGEKSPNAKLTAAKVQEIRFRYDLGELQKDLAREFGVNQTAISSITRRRTWAHV
jgi:hypothetical protein